MNSGSLMYRAAKSLQKDLTHAQKRIKRLRAYIAMIESKAELQEWQPEERRKMRAELINKGDLP